ncbi:hypothetical protein CEB3_c37840 [Peptococcaceae bacterium CEB3]|nr:hypothetical protein CEB3_c37840 [Peptococcaceae bacterium CEB3]
MNDRNGVTGAEPDLLLKVHLQASAFSGPGASPSGSAPGAGTDEQQGPGDLAAQFSAKSGTFDSAATWQVLIPIDKKKFQDLKQVYDVNKQVEVAGQKILFRKLSVYPTRISIDLACDPANTRKILFFDDLAVVDEKGNKVGAIANGISGSTPDADHRTLCYQSNYFAQSKELYIEGSSIRAVDKSEESVRVDLNKSTLIGNPAG